MLEPQEQSGLDKGGGEVCWAPVGYTPVQVMCTCVQWSWPPYLGDDSCFCSEPLPKNLFPRLCTSLTPHTSHTITTITTVTTPWLCKLKGCRTEYLKVRGVRV